MIPSFQEVRLEVRPVYQRGWMIDSQLAVLDVDTEDSISKGMDD